MQKSKASLYRVRLVDEWTNTATISDPVTRTEAQTIISEREQFAAKLNCKLIPVKG